MTEQANGRLLEDQVAVVTGASRGLGRAVAEALAREGAHVAVAARTPEPLEALAEEIGGWAVPCDVTRPDQIEDLAREVIRQAGRTPDLVVAAAGVFDLAPVHATPLEVLDRNLQVNLRGAILTVQAFLPAFLEAGRGTIIQVGSVAGRKAFPGNAAYSASKFGLRGFHQVLLEELRGSGVRATLLEPAATDTSIWDPMDPDRDPALPDRATMLRPHDVAEAVLFAASRAPGVQIPFFPVERS